MSAPAIGTFPLKTEPSFDPTDAIAGSGSKGYVQAFNSKDGPSFSDVLDVINPLQHIPLVNTLYRKLTGDSEGGVAEAAGGLLWGGPIGLGFALANLTVEDSTGKGIDDHMIAMVTGDDDSTTAIAKADQPAQPAATVAAAAAPAEAADGDGDTPPMVAFAPPPAVVREAIAAPPKAAKTQVAAAATVSPDLALDGPVRAGDTLYFGGPAASSAKPAVLASAAPAPAAQAVPQSAPKLFAGKQGDTMIFGGDAATSLPAAPDSDAAASNAATPAVTAAAAAPTSLTQTDGRVLKPLPPRNMSLTPRAVLPLPTTGPAAVPGSGGVSQALHPGAQQGDESWFPGAFNAAMDKYQKTLNNNAAATPSDQSTQTAPTGTLLN